MWKPRQKLLSWPDLLTVRLKAKEAGQVVVWTNGSFDLLHPGHLQSLQQARELGDLLIVGLNSDESVRGYKGPQRPILTQDERAAMLVGLECVDYVMIFDEPTPEAALAKLQPDIHCKGAEYSPPDGKPVPEAPLVHSYGGSISYLPLLEGLSTTALLQRIREKTSSSKKRTEL